MHYKVYLLPYFNITITNISLEYLNNHLWIKFKKVRDGHIHDKNHSFYVCPAIFSNQPCSRIIRNDYPAIYAHRCRKELVHQQSILAFPHTSLSHQFSSEEQFIFQQAMITAGQSSKPAVDYELLNAFVEAIAKSNISFNAVCSDAFRNFLELLVRRVLPPETVFPQRLFQTLHYRNLIDIILTISKRRTLEMQEVLQGKCVTVMMDGGVVGNSKITAITLLINQPHTLPLFLGLEPPCANEEDYRNLATKLIQDLSHIGADVVAFCSDGLASQKKALSSLISSELDHPTVMRPFHIYCSNHLMNLVIQHSCERNGLLHSIADMLRDISRDARVYSASKVIGQICPAFVETRWYTLTDICQFTIKNREILLELGLILPDALLAIMKFHILFNPLFHLHAYFEHTASRLSFVFPYVMNCIHDLLSLANTSLFKGSWLYSIRTVVSCIYEYFISGERGNLFGLAYFLHPIGRHVFHQSIYRLHRNKKFNIPIIQDQSTTQENQIHYTPEQLSAQFRSSAKQKLQSEMEDDILKDSQTTTTSASSSSSTRASSPIPPTFSQVGSSYDGGNSLPLTTSFAYAAMKRLKMRDDQSTETQLLPADDQELVLSDPDLITLIEEFETISAVIEPTSDPADSSTSHPVTGEAAVQQSTPEEFSGDFFGLLEASMDMKDGTYKEKHSSSSKQIPKEQSISHPYSTRTKGFTSVIEDDVIPIEQPSGTPSRTFSRDSVPNIALLPMKQQPAYTNDETEKVHLSNLREALEGNWAERLEQGYRDFLENHLLETNPGVISQLVDIMRHSLAPARDGEIMDANSYYWSMSLNGDVEALFGYIAANIADAVCSEASCERVFSIVKWIIGDRRYALKLRTLEVLVRLVFEKGGGK